MRPADSSAGKLWPIDKLATANSGITICVLGVASWHHSRALLFILGHVGIIALIFMLALHRSKKALFLHYWYPLAYLPICYKEVPYLVSALGLRTADSTLAGWDLMMWKTDPLLWLSTLTLQNHVVVEFLQFVYTMFIPGVFGLAIIFWHHKSRQEFRYATFLIAASFLLSYMGYLLLPARGPRFMEHAAEFPPLQGLWTFRFFQRVLDALEGVQYDCFPSAHVAVVLIGCYLAAKVSALAFYIFATFSALIILSTVYLRYHYVIDVIAGFVLASFVLAIGSWVYHKLNTDTTTLIHKGCA